MSVKEKISGFVLDKAMNHISGDPETNLPKLLGWVDALGIKSFEPQSKAIHEVLDDPDNIWNQFIMSIWRDVDNDVLKSVFQNFALKAAILGNPKQDALSEKLGCNIPMALLIDPTSACNLKCTGCWAAEYGDKLNMSYETLDSIIQQGKELNIRDKTLLEALQSPLFMAYHNGQPFNKNHLRVCPLLDNPDALVGMVEASGAHSTDLQDPEDVRDLSAKCETAAENWADVADRLWSCSGHCSACQKQEVG